MNGFKLSARLLFVAVYAAIALACAGAVQNPDLFWHLASARAAAESGVLTLREDVFTFSRAGDAWINFEWLFQWIVWRVYSLAGFGGLVALRIATLMFTIGLVSAYAARRWSEPCDDADTDANGVGWPTKGRPNGIEFAPAIFPLMFFGLIWTRATDQPELFTLMFLPLFLFLRDRLLAGAHAALWIGCAALFAVWVNIHGGYVFAIGILVLQILGRLAYVASIRLRPSRLRPGSAAPPNLAMNRLGVMLAVTIAAACVNPYGPAIFKILWIHLRELGLTANLIREWRVAMFEDTHLWLFWAVFGLSALGALARVVQRRPAGYEEALIVMAFGFFAAGHIRNVAVSGLVILPILAGQVASINMSLKVMRRVVVAAVSLVAVAQLPILARNAADVVRDARRIAANGGSYILPDAYPLRACDFIAAQPGLLRLRGLADFGWGGYAEFRLQPLGLRVFYDGRYLFHSLLDQTAHASLSNETWQSWLDEKNVEMILFKLPEKYYPLPDPTSLSSQPVYRSWHGWVYDRSVWALVWWDELSGILVRRSTVDATWLERNEYRHWLPLDPFVTERAIRASGAGLDDVLTELDRNIAAAGPNPRNRAFRSVYAE